MAQTRSLEGKLAIVTGASRGIGAAICENLAAKGCNLVMNYTSASSESRTYDLAQKLSNTHSIKAVVCRADMGSITDPQSLVNFTRDTFMNPKSGSVTVDIVINNAGIAGNRRLFEATAEQLAADFEAQYNVNVRGPMLLVHAAQPFLPTDRTGRIVNVSSVSSTLGFEGQSVYGGTKAALESMTRTWARELGQRATVNAINPGPVVTDMYGDAEEYFKTNIVPFLKSTPRAQVKEGLDDPAVIKEAMTAGPDGGETGGRPATPAEIAGLVGVLCLPDSTWCTGSMICANGGMRFSP